MGIYFKSIPGKIVKLSFDKHYDTVTLSKVRMKLFAAKKVRHVSMLIRGFDAQDINVFSIFETKVNCSCSKLFKRF